MKVKKGVFPVIAVALLIVISVFAVIGFQNWFGTYSSEIYVKTETDSSDTSNTNIETLIGNQLYFKNNYDENISIKQIKIGEKECNISANVSSGISTISLGTCIDNLNLDSNIEDIVIITDKEIYTKKHLFKDVKISSSPLVQNFINVGYNLSPEGLFYGQNWLLINATANSSIQSCSLNFNGTINTSFTIQNNNCWINQPLNSFGNYTYNVTIIANNSAQNTTISKILEFIEMYQSCKQILDSGKSVGDGVYNLDPDAMGPITNSSFYCDMTTDGGGWTVLVGNNLYSSGVFSFSPSITGGSQSYTNGQIYSTQGTTLDASLTCHLPSPVFNMYIYMPLTQIKASAYGKWFNVPLKTGGRVNCAINATSEYIESQGSFTGTKTYTPNVNCGGEVQSAHIYFQASSCQYQSGNRLEIHYIHVR